MRDASRACGQDAVQHMPPAIVGEEGEAPMEAKYSGRSSQGLVDPDLTKSPGNQARETWEDELLGLTDEEAEWLALLGPDLFWRAWTRRTPKEFRTRDRETGRYLPGRRV